MEDIDIGIPDFTIFFVIMIICCCCCCCCCCCRCTNSIETRHKKDLLFKDIREEEEGDDHEISRLKKCRHSFHRFCIEYWLKRKRSCPSCRRSV
ncbi:hypothetical protein N665_4259s0001 [Sinapis alba]|nr:hypothetical protein N665_4259s0001 [Sinapis alba]